MPNMTLQQRLSKIKDLQAINKEARTRLEQEAVDLNKMEADLLKEIARAGVA